MTGFHNYTLRESNCESFWELGKGSGGRPPALPPACHLAGVTFDGCHLFACFYIWCAFSVLSRPRRSTPFAVHVQNAPLGTQANRDGVKSQNNFPTLHHTCLAAYEKLGTVSAQIHLGLVLQSILESLEFKRKQFGLT